MTRPALRPCRHDFVWVDPGVFGTTLIEREMAAWAASGLPFVQRTGAPAAGEVLLGWSRPLGAPHKRVALAVPSSGVRARARPPNLELAAEAAPRAWRPILADLISAARPTGLTVRIYGSLAWAWITNLRYVWSGSDLDVLILGWEDAKPASAKAFLEQAAAVVRPRIDGEIVLTTGDAVAWREVRSGADRLLARSIRGPALVSRELLAPGL